MEIFVAILEVVFEALAWAFFPSHRKKKKIEQKEKEAVDAEDNSPV